MSELIKLEKLCFTPHFPIPKKTYANRTVILMANGLQTLTVPIVGGRGSKIPMDQIEISYLENWIAKHKMALQSAYAKSSYYEHYMPYFEPIWAAKPHTLMQLNLNMFKMLSKVLKLHVEIVEEENTNLSEVQFILIFIVRQSFRILKCFDINFLFTLIYLFSISYFA